MKSRPSVLLAVAEAVERTQIEAAVGGAGYALTCAEDAAAVMHTAETRRPSIIVLSENLGGPGGGLTLCRHLKADPSTRGTGVVLLVGRDTELVPTDGADGRPDEVLVRPLHPPEVLVRLGAVLRIQRYASEAVEGSKMDTLTGTFNNAHLVERLRHEVLRAARYGRSLAVVLLDLDRFAAINSRESPIFGDLVLREVARALTSRLRGVDLVARTGPDDFSVVLPETSLLVARPIAERLRLAVESLSDTMVTEAGRRVQISASLGIAGLPHPEAKDGAELLRCAREALARARSAGGNRCEVY